MKNKMVQVFWVDSMAMGGWRELEENVQMNCESVGFLILKNKERIILALNFVHGQNAVPWGHHLHIPMVSVKKIKYLK